MVYAVSLSTPWKENFFLKKGEFFSFSTCTTVLYYCTTVLYYTVEERYKNLVLDLSK